MALPVAAATPRTFGKEKDVVAEINKSFKRISRRLFRRSLNYCADFKLFRCDGMAGESLDSVVTAALGKDARVGRAQSATKDEIMDALQSALRFRGDDGAHPSLNYLESPKSREDFDGVTAEVQSILDQSDLLLSFWLESGHPFYPVFWDFAFLIETGEDAILFIASSSD